MPKLRLRITVPRPESTINLGNPDLDGRFGWEGISLKSDRHFFATIEDDTVFQSGGSTLLQTEEKWHQFAAEMAHGAEEKMYLTSGQALVLFSGGGQGSRDEAELGEGTAPPITNTYNKLDLMALVQKKATQARAFLGPLTRSGDLDTRNDPFLLEDERLQLRLGHRDTNPNSSDHLPTGDQTEQGWVKSTVSPRPANPITRALEDIEEGVNRLVGIETDHDMMARFNPYSGVRGVVDFVDDLINKCESLVASENIAVKVAKGITDSIKSLQSIRDAFDSLAQDFEADENGEWLLAHQLEDDYKGEYDEPPAEELGQATLFATSPPWRLSGDGPWEIRIGVDGAEPQRAGLITAADVADRNAVTLEEVQRAITDPRGAQIDVASPAEVSSGGGSGDGTLRFRSPTVGNGSRVEVRGSLAEALGVSDVDEIGRGAREDDFAQLTDKADKITNVWQAWSRTSAEPFRRLTSLHREALKEVENLLGLVESVVGIVDGLTEPPGPLGLFAKSGISLGTEDRVYGAASRGFYFVADGGKDAPKSHRFVPKALEILDVIDTAINRKKERPPVRSLGFRVRTDSDVDLKGDYFVSLTAVDDTGLARVESGGVTDVTAMKGVAVGPRDAGSYLEMFGSDILIGVREHDKPGIKIKDHAYHRAPAPPAEETAHEPEPLPRATWEANAQNPTNTISLSAEQRVTIEVGAPAGSTSGGFVVEILGDHIRIGSRRESSAPTQGTAWTPGQPAREGSPETAATPGQPGQRAVVTVDPDKPIITISADGITIDAKDHVLNLKGSTVNLNDGAFAVGRRGA
jgi:hypothetical protein